MLCDERRQKSMKIMMRKKNKKQMVQTKNTTKNNHITMLMTLRLINY
jgi:hypothetical protein